MEIAIKILVAVIGIYEIASRAIPSIKDWTILGNIMNLLKKISDALNNKIV